MDQVQIRFFDRIVTPWRELVDLATAHPIAANPDSNKLTVAADVLATSLRHFKERHPTSPVAKVWISHQLLHWADSVKHATETGRKKGGRDYSEETVSCFISPTYEHLNGSFRFIRNEMTCAYTLATGVNSGREFSALEVLWAAIGAYAAALGLDVSKFAPRESSYGFLPVAVAFNIPEYAAYTKSMRIKFFRKSAGGYEPFAPKDVKLVVLGSDNIGADLSKLDWEAIQAGF